jgi:RNA polymerase sigma-70 factor, ECF subfamily
VGEGSIPPHEADELAACFGAHARDLFGYACVLVRGDRALADDLVQAAFQAASRDWPALRRLADEQRRGWLRATLAGIAISGFHGTEAFQADTQERAFSRATLERCWQIIQGMPEQLHAVALLRWMADMKEGEIAAALGLAEKTVTTHLHRVRRKLIEQLGPDNPYTSDDPDGAS